MSVCINLTGLKSAHQALNKPAHQVTQLLLYELAWWAGCLVI